MAGPVVARRHREEQRLNRTIERRIEAQRNLAFLRCPRRVAGLQLLRALDAAIGHLQRKRHVVLNRDVLRKLEHPACAFPVNLDVGEQIVFTPLRLQRSHKRIELVELGAERLTILIGQLIGRWGLAPGRRSAPWVAGGGC